MIPIFFEKNKQEKLISSVYSSLYTATQILYIFHKRKKESILQMFPVNNYLDKKCKLVADKSIDEAPTIRDDGNKATGWKRLEHQKNSF